MYPTKKPILLLFFLFPFLLSAQSKLDNSEILDLVKSTINASSNQKKQAVDQLELNIQDHHTSKQSKIDHYYFRQKHQGLEIYGSESSIHLLPSGKVLKLNNRMSSLQKDNASDVSIKPGLNALQAIKAAAKEMNYGPVGNLSIIEPAKGLNQKQLISQGNISQTAIPAELRFHRAKEGELILAWDISIQEAAGEDWWSMRVDAQTGEILDKNNWVVHCNHGSISGEIDPVEFPFVDKHNDCTDEDHAALIGGYRVFATPISDPSDGSRTLEIDPDNAIASPFGWHDTNGVAGPEFTTTQGNNVHAYDSGNNPGYSPDGGASLQFDFPLDLSADPELYEDPAITNIFYWGNKVHDILYQYGFDEAGGNFQENNYGNGGAASDYVNIRVQTSLTCNGSFGTPSDGNNPTMTMYICNGRDGGFNNTTTIHEYGHGVSNRLTGGPSTTGCLSNQEQMGEGWSDFLAMLFTIESTDTRTTTRAYGDWFYGNPNGIRPYVYNTDITVNSSTYNNIDGVSVPHGVGNVWASMLWEMSWNLIDNYGFDSDLYTGTGGNNIALQLVMEGMKLQPCSPGFVDGRDAILAADVALYGGANECFIWEAFAKRGLGINADQGSTGSVTDGVESFSLPVSCGGTDCSLSFASGSSVDLGFAAANNLSFDVLSNGLGNWDASTTASWITINSPTGSVSGNGTVNFSVSENTDALPRTATIEVTCDGSFTIYYTINQERQPCTQAYTPIPYSTSFESGTLDAFWCANSSVIEGRIQVTTLNAPRTGSYHLTLDVNVDGVYNTNEANLGLQLAGETNVELSFWWKEFSDEDNVEDGVFFSDDGGVTYVKVYDLIGGSTAYTQVLLDVSQLAAANGLSLTNNFVVKFQQYDNFTIATDGFAFDDISVTAGTCSVGGSCDDGDVCTINDIYDANCACAGTFQDTDSDGVCDANDQCPGTDDALIGTSCDDGDICTINDIYDSNCACTGTFHDTDNDGVCDAFDQCPGIDDALIGTSCDDGDVCTTNDTYDANCACAGTFQDSDNDTVCDANDLCPGFDDLIDTNNNGIPDGCDNNCVNQSTVFPQDPLTHTGGGSSSTTLVFTDLSQDVSFTITGLNQRLNGKSTGRFIDLVTVTYVNGSGTTITEGSYSAANQSSAAISITGVVQSVTVSLTDGYDGNTNANMSVNLGTVIYCGTPCADSDGDGVCDAVDACPGFDDNLDADGDGIPDGCDNCSTVVNPFSPSTLTHSGTGSSSVSLSLSGVEDPAFTISGLGSRPNGNPGSRFIDIVNVEYTDGSGTVITLGPYSGANQNSVAINIAGVVQNITVLLSDGYDGNSPSISVNLSDVISCSSAAERFNQVSDFQGKELAFEVSPNPFTEMVSVKLDAPAFDRSGVLHLLDASGRLLLQQPFQWNGEHNLLLDLGEWNTGIYFLRYSDAHNTMVKKLIKIN